MSRINLALDEVLTNVISYAYDDAGAHEIEVRLEVEGEDVVVEVTDDGRPFDPLSVAAARRRPTARGATDRRARDASGAARHGPRGVSSRRRAETC